MNAEIKAYAGFTIGPIYELMRHAKKTRELWFGSYFFSWYMEGLIGRLLATNAGEFLTPFVPTDDAGRAIPNRSATGKYHDRFVLSSSLSPDELFQQVRAANEQTLDFFVQMALELVGEEPMRGGQVIQGSRDAIERILSGFLQTRFISLAKEQLQAETVVGGLDAYLNSLEEEFIFAPGKSKQTCERCKTLPGVVRVKERGEEDEPDKIFPLCPFCLLKYRANRIPEVLEKLPPENLDKGRLIYPSVMEVAAADILAIPAVKEKIPQSAEKELEYAQLEAILKNLNQGEAQAKVPEKLRRFHRYFAVVQADGDSLGKLAAGIPEPAELSERLFEFVREGEKLVQQYGGLPIFMGGDDLLAFLPVYYQGRTVVDFAQELSQIYKKTVDQGAGKTSLSVGLNIAYYKFPLANALKRAGELLFGDAKAKKDSLAICLTQHSGAETRFCLKLGEKAFALFSDLIRNVLMGLSEQTREKPAQPGESEETPPAEKGFKLPGGIRYNLGRFEAVLAEIPDKERLTAFFANNFDLETEHKRFQGGIAAAEDLFAHYLFERPGEKPDQAVAQALKMLGFIRFLTGEED